VSPTPPHAPGRAPHEGRDPRERLRRALADLHPASPWTGVLTTALEVLDEPGPQRARALSWLHHALRSRLPEEPRRDTLEQRVLRRAAHALEDELEGDDSGGRRAA